MTIDPADVRRRTRALTAACAAHVLHDGYLDLLYVLLPIWKIEFDLGYAAVGLIRATYSAAMAAAQVPVDRMTSRIEPRSSLFCGALLSALAFALAGLSHGIGLLCFSLVLAGLGSSTQHPRAAAMVTEAFHPKARSALGIYNFAGDLGKAIFPGLVALLLIALTWHEIAFVLALIGLAFAAALFMLVPRSGGSGGANEADLKREGRNDGGFWLLFAIGAFDTATRMGFLLFLPFILAGHQASHAIVGIGLALVFAGGAFGKIAFGWLGERFGLAGTVATTELATAVMVLAVPTLSLRLMLPLLFILGVALNGTSSVLYATVPDVAKSGDTSGAFALFYSGVIGAGALAPIIFGALADHAGRNTALIAVASTALLAIPLAIFLQRQLSSASTMSVEART